MIISIIKKILPVFFSIITILLIWFLISNKINSVLIIPSPKQVFSKILFYISSSKFWINFLYTFTRCICSFFITIFSGILIGLICSQNEFLNKFFDFPLSIIRSTPVIAVILIALYWFNSSIVPSFVSILMTLPIVVSAIIKGLNNSDKKLIEMSKVYQLTKLQTFIYIKIPSAIPFFLNSIVSIFGLTWKVVVAGEVLSLPKKGIGTILQQNQVILETADVMAVTILLVTMCFLLEKILTIFIAKLNKRAN